MSDNKYPFESNVRLKDYVSQLDLNLDFDNIKSSMERARSWMQNVMSPEVYNRMMEIYNAAVYVGRDHEEYNKITELSQPVMANMAIYFHFIWLQIRISNQGVTTYKSDDETTAFKYQSDEGKLALIETANVFLKELIEYLNENTETWSDWQPETNYTIDDWVRFGGFFYKCAADHTSGNVFSVESSDPEPLQLWDSREWTDWQPLTEYEVGDYVKANGNFYKCVFAHISPENFALDTGGTEPTVLWGGGDYADVEPIFWRWRDSTQYNRLQKIVFSDYNDFALYAGIQPNALYFSQCIPILLNTIDDDLSVRIENPALTEGNLRKYIKYFLANRAKAVSIHQMDYEFLPAPIRASINNQHSRKSNDAVIFARDKISQGFALKAETWLERIDMLLAEARSSETDTGQEIEEITPQPDENNKFFSAL